MDDQASQIGPTEVGPFSRLILAVTLCKNAGMLEEPSSVSWLFAPASPAGCDQNPGRTGTQQGMRVRPVKALTLGPFLTLILTLRSRHDQFVHSCRQNSLVTARLLSSPIQGS
jgi:hypothetical protein